LAVLLWLAVDAQARNQGQAKSDPAKVQQNAPRPSNAPGNAPSPAQDARKDAGKGERGKPGPQEGVTAGQPKPGGPQGKDARPPLDAKEEAIGKGKGGVQRAQSLQKRLQHEQDKHMERHARLTRIRELAVQKGDQEMIARVDKLIQKEQQIFDRKSQRLQGQPRVTPQPPTNAGTGAVAPAGPGSGAKHDGRPDGGKEPGKQGPSKPNP